MGELFEQKYPSNVRVVSGLGVVPKQDDVVLLCDTDVNPVTIDLLEIPANKWSTQYKLYVVDNAGGAPLHNITINAPAGYKINGQNSIVIDKAYAGIMIRVLYNEGYIASGDVAAGGISDDAFGVSWNGVTDIGASKNALFDKLTAIDSSINGLSANSPIRVPVTFSPAQIKASNTTPILFLNAPATIETWRILEASAKLDFNTTPYASAFSINLFTSGSTPDVGIQQSCRILDATEYTHRYFDKKIVTDPTDKQLLPNKGLYMGANLVDPIDGDSDITIYVTVEKLITT